MSYERNPFNRKVLAEDKRKRVVSLYLEEKLSVKAIASRTSLTPETVRNVLKHVLRQDNLEKVSPRQFSNRLSSYLSLETQRQLLLFSVQHSKKVSEILQEAVTQFCSQPSGK